MLNLRRHGVIGHSHGLVDNVASGNFLGAKVKSKLACTKISSFCHIILQLQVFCNVLSAKFTSKQLHTRVNHRFSGLVKTAVNRTFLILL
jgi:hypothetical protein